MVPSDDACLLPNSKPVSLLISLVSKVQFYSVAHFRWKINESECFKSKTTENRNARQTYAIRISYFLICSLFTIVYSGVSANAGPHTYKLRTRVVHIWDYRRRQLNRSAMEEPLPGETAFLITVFPVPGKYASHNCPKLLYATFQTMKWWPVKSSFCS